MSMIKRDMQNQYDYVISTQEWVLVFLRPVMLTFTGRYFFDFSRRLSQLRWSEAESKWLVAYLRNSVFLGVLLSIIVLSLGEMHEKVMESST